MATIETYLDFVRIKERKVDETSLKEYLDSVLTEEAKAEFKTAADDVDFQFRKAVASLANRHGGEVFVGVREPGPILSGTTLTADQLNDRLRQQAQAGDWYSTDLSTLLIQTKPVPLSEPGKQVLVAEVRRGILPSMVVDSDGAYGEAGGLIWFRRHGRTDRRLSGFEGVEARRDYLRGQLLLRLFREFEMTARTIPMSPTQGVPVGRAHFSLPGYAGARADGSFYSQLAAPDLEFLFASRPNGNGLGTPGLLPSYIAAGERLDRIIEKYVRSKNQDWEGTCGNEVRIAQGDAMRNVGRFRNHLVSLGILSKE
jgi:hypothetical protein